MSRKLEELFNLPTLDSVGSEEILSETEPAELDEVELLPELDSLNDKINTALPQVKGLQTSDSEFDEIATKAMEAFDELMLLGKDVEARHAADIFATAANLLGHALTAKKNKAEKKLKEIDLQLKKFNLDQRVKAKEPEEDQTQVDNFKSDRNSIMAKIIAARPEKIK